MELDIMPYCEDCPYFEREERGGDVVYVDGIPFFETPITICCEKREICERMERKIKGE